MNRKRWLTVGLTASGLVLAGSVIAVSPALGASTPSPTASATGQQFGMRYRGGAGPGAGMAGQAAGNTAAPGTGAGAMGRGMGPGDGTCLDPTAPTGTLTDSQRATLRSMAEEEKMAHDLYAAFADKYQVRIFDRIAKAESAHLSAVRTLLDRYNLTDPTANLGAGEFSSDSVKSTYDKLLAQGLASRTAALGVGRTVEQADIADLTKALNGLTAADVTQVYQHLLAASRQHLTAFESWLK